MGSVNDMITIYRVYIGRSEALRDITNFKWGAFSNFLENVLNKSFILFCHVPIRLLTVF